MAGLGTVSLRDAGLRLAQLQDLKEKVASGRLLSLLKADRIRAGFQFPVGDAISWITIPASYWTAVTNDKFKVIRQVKERPSSGAYKIRLGDFAAEVVAHVSKDANKSQGAGHIWKAVVAATSQRYEVAIIEEDWIAYETANPPTRSLSTRRKGGRHEKTGWRDTSVIIGAYIMKHCQQTRERLKVEEASQVIYKLVVAAEIPDPPKAPTIEEVLSRIRDLADVISIN